MSDDEPPLADFWLALYQAAERWLPPDRFQVFIDHVDKLFMQWDAEDEAPPSASVTALLRGRITAQSSMRGELLIMS